MTVEPQLRKKHLAKEKKKNNKNIYSSKHVRKLSENNLRRVSPISNNGVVPLGSPQSSKPSGRKG
jgi:hypothetical protein